MGILNRPLKVCFPKNDTFENGQIGFFLFINEQTSGRKTTLNCFKGDFSFGLFLAYYSLNQHAMKYILQFLVIPLLLLSSSCDERNYSISTASVQEKKNLTGVTRLQLDGVFNLTLTQSDQESIEVVGDESMIKKLLINQDGDLLTLSTEEDLNNNFLARKELRINLNLKNLKELNYDGVGNVKTMGTFKVADVRLIGAGVGNLELDLDAQQIDANFDMVGNINLQGKANRAFFTNNGVGNLDASNLIVKDMEINSSGIGNVEVHCSGDLSLMVDGIGKVSYSGNPRIIKKEVSGIGKVEEN